MPSIITFDGETLLDANIITRFVKHESPADRTVSTLPITREDGSVFVTSRYGEKIVSFEGNLVGSSQADLETRLDALQELLSREQKELEMDWNGATRIYVATCRNLLFDRDHFNILHVPFTGEFVVPSGEGVDDATTAALNDEALETDVPVDSQFILAGSKPAKPVINIQGNDWPSGVLGLSLENLDTGEKMDVTSLLAWGTATEIEIDCAEKLVEHVISGVRTSLDFYGTIPKWRIGENNIRLTVGKLPNQYTIEPTIADVAAASAMGEDLRYANSFQVPYTNGTFRKIRVPIQTFGTPTGDLTARIETDDGGEPSGSAVATLTIAAASLTGGATMTYYELTAGAPFTLNGGQTYWLVLYGADFDNSNGAFWGSVASVYGIPGGIVRASGDAGASWGSPLSRFQAFILYYGGLDGASDVLLNVDYQKLWL